MTLATGRQPVIGYDNVFNASGTITASNEIANFGKAYAYDWKTTTRWGAASGTQTLTIDRGVGNSSSCDYFAIGAHNLATVGATVKLQKSANGSTWSDICIVTPASDAVIFQTFTEASARYWRVQITNSSASVYIGVIAAGLALEPPSTMMVGFTPPKYGREDEILQSITEGGNFAGSSVITQRNECRISFEYLSPSWVSSNWLTLLAHIRVKPFFFLWDKDNQANDTALLWLKNGEMPKVKYTHNNLMSVDMDCEGVI